MNKICETCDTRNRLGMCTGKEGNFKYCYRKCGSIDGIKESIQPFNELSELKDNEYLQYSDIDSLHIEEYSGNHFSILIGKHKKEYNDNKEYPMGFIIK